MSCVNNRHSLSRHIAQGEGGDARKQSSKDLHLNQSDYMGQHQTNSGARQRVESRVIGYHPMQTVNFQDCAPEFPRNRAKVHQIQVPGNADVEIRGVYRLEQTAVVGLAGKPAYKGLPDTRGLKLVNIFR